MVKRIHNFALTSDSYERKKVEGIDSPQPLAASISKEGNGFVVWNTFVSVGQPPFGQVLVLQVLKNFVPQEDHTIQRNTSTTFGSVYLNVNAVGKGLFVWTEAPQIMNSPFMTNSNLSLNSLNIERWLPEKQVSRISDASKGSVDASSVTLTNEGNGMISWTQFNEPCPSEAQCNLAQTVWSKAVFQFRSK